MLNKFENINLGLLPAPPFKQRWIVENVFPTYTDVNAKYFELQEHLRLHTDKRLIANYLRLVIRTGSILQKFKNKIEAGDVVDFRELSVVIDIEYILQSSFYACKTVAYLNKLIEANDMEGLTTVYAILEELLVYVQNVFEILSNHTDKEIVFEKMDVI